MKKIITIIALTLIIVASASYSIKKTINAKNNTAAAVAPKTTIDVNKGGVTTGNTGSTDVSDKSKPAEGCVQKLACNYVGDEAVKAGAIQGNADCKYTNYIAGATGDGTKDLNKISQIRNNNKYKAPKLCSQKDKKCQDLSAVSVWDIYDNGVLAFSYVWQSTSVGKVTKDVAQRYNGSKACDVKLWDTKEASDAATTHTPSGRKWTKEELDHYMETLKDGLFGDYPKEVK